MEGASAVIQMMEIMEKSMRFFSPLEKYFQQVYRSNLINMNITPVSKRIKEN